MIPELPGRQKSSKRYTMSFSIPKSLKVMPSLPLYWIIIMVMRRLHNYDSGHFEELSETRNLNDSNLLRFLPSVEMTNNGSCAKFSCYACLILRYIHPFK